MLKRLIRSVRDRMAPILSPQRWKENKTLRRSLTTWCVSVSLHILMLVLLTLMVYASNRGKDDRWLDAKLSGQLRDDVTSLFPSDHAGDSFTRLTSADPLSIGKDPNSNEIHLTDMEKTPLGADFKIDIPKSPDLAPVPLEASSGKFGMATSMSGRDEGVTGTGSSKIANGSGKTKAGGKGRLGTKGSGGEKGFGSGGNGLESDLSLITGPSVPFTGRSGETKAKLVKSQGGTVESERAVELGLDWLVRHQRRDGSWALDTSEECKGHACPYRRAAVSDTAATGLALLPMLGAGHTHAKKSRYQIAIRRGLDWLVKHQDADGEMFEGGLLNSGMYSHAIATLALTEAYGLTGDKRLQKPAQRGIDYIVASQNQNDGGWRYAPGMAGDTSVFGWQMFSLRSAALARLNVPKDTIALGRHYLDLAAADDNGSTYAYLPGRQATPVMTAEALLGRQYFGWKRDNPSLVKGASLLLANLRESSDRNIYYWYYATQMLHNMGGEDWEAWNGFIRENLISTQMITKACDKGSWDPQVPATDRHARIAGRLYLTSLSLLTLEVYYRYLPLYQDQSSFAGPKAGNEPERDLKATDKLADDPAMKKAKVPAKLKAPGLDEDDDEMEKPAPPQALPKDAMPKDAMPKDAMPRETAKRSRPRG